MQYAHYAGADCGERTCCAGEELDRQLGYWRVSKLRGVQQVLAGLCMTDRARGRPDCPPGARWPRVRAGRPATRRLAEVRVFRTPAGGQTPPRVRLSWPASFARCGSPSGDGEPNVRSSGSRSARSAARTPAGPTISVALSPNTTQPLPPLGWPANRTRRVVGTRQAPPGTRCQHSAASPHFEEARRELAPARNLYTPR